MVAIRTKPDHHTYTFPGFGSEKFPNLLLRGAGDLNNWHLKVYEQHEGYVAMKAVAKAIGIPEGHVFGVATFYTMYQKAPVGKYHFSVCTNISCALRGAAQLLEKVCEKTGVQPGAGPSPDGMWSVEEVECLAGCGVAPCIQVNHDVYDELVDEAKLIEVMEACKRGDYRPWAE